MPICRCKTGVRFCFPLPFLCTAAILLKTGFLVSWVPSFLDSQDLLPGFHGLGPQTQVPGSSDPLGS